MKIFFAGLTFAAAALWSLCAHAQANQPYPSRPIKWIVDAAAGGSSDAYARLIGKHLQEEWGQPAVIENRPGASGAVAFTQTVRAPADGYTVVSATNTLTLGLAYKTNLPYTLKDFAPISLFFTAPNALVVPAGSPVRSFGELSAFARGKPGLNYGTPGIGSASHLSAELLGRRLGFPVVHIPFTGGTPVVNELLAGRLDFAFVNIPNAAPFIREGKLRILAVSSGERLEQFPQTPTISEFLPGFVINTWFGVIARAGTPDAVLAKLNAEVNRALQTPELKKRIQDAGAEPRLLSVAAFRDFLDQDLANWTRVLKEAQVDLKE
jgi:tripartite-type tricarboxylate transporter receptor subunit TctC